MASSSLLFGGLTLWHARQRDGQGVEMLGAGVLANIVLQWQRFLDWHQLVLFHLVEFMQSMDPRTFAWLMSTLCLLVLLAYSTNPGDTSFRSYLTELSLHQHLHQLRQEVPTIQETLTDEQLLGATRREAEKSLSPHILTFANRISVSLRTPRYERRDFGIFCTVTVPRTTLLRHSSTHRPTSTRYVGVFGKWWVSGLVNQSLREEKQKHERAMNGRSQEGWGVLKMKAENSNEQEKNFTNDKMSASKATTGVVTPSKTPANAQVGDAVLSPQGGKPSGRRKKQSHKAKPPHLQTEGETSALEYKVGGGELSAISGSLSARLTDGVEKSNQGDQQSPLAMSPLPSAIEANGSNAGLIDFQAQLEQVRLASDASKKQLQVQLEELRSRKRDEDAARLDVKGRMKILDESKRHAEGSKREAERRLKVANGLRESIENKIEGKMQEMEDWKAKKATNEVKIQQSGEKKTMRIAELRVEIRKKEEESHEAEEDLEHLKARLETLQQRMLEEEANLEAARELAVERDIAALANRSYVNPSDHSFQFHNTYPLLSGPGDLGDHSMGDMSTDASQYTGWDAHNRGYQSYGGLSQGLNHPIALISDDIKEDLDETFDPTIAPSPLVETHSTFAPFSFDRSAFQSNMIIPSTEQTSSIVPMFSEGSSIPITPFTSDLLPSNLFQNADDDERHVGVLPGTRSEQVEAALNRFGLDTSDTSDVEGSGEGVDNLLGNGDLQGNINEKEDNEEEEEGGEEKDLSRSNSNLRTAARSWWNARSRNASKDRSTSSSIAALSSVDNANTPDAVIEAVPQREAAKRRSISIFPKLSLNPGAKSFRGPSKKADNGIQFADHDDLAAQSSWSSATGQIPTRQDFESMKRAFQSNLLGAGQQDEEEGRKSWSAFDTWQQQQQFQQRNGSFTAVNTGNRPMTNFPSHINNAMYQNQRASSESLAQIRRLPSSSTSPQGTNWLDDVFLPLHKSQSIDDTNSSASSTSINRSSNRVGKPSRFSFWSSNGSSNHNSGPPANPSSPSITATSEGGSVSLDSAPALQQQLSSHSGTPQPSKRTSFRWSRRQESSSTDVQALSEKIKDQD